MTNEHNPADVATNMVMVRGREAALVRCDRYIDGSVRSENPREFWQAVRDAILTV